MDRKKMWQENFRVCEEVMRLWGKKMKRGSVKRIRSPAGGAGQGAERSVLKWEVRWSRQAHVSPGFSVCGKFCIV